MSSYSEKGGSKKSEEILKQKSKPLITNESYEIPREQYSNNKKSPPPPKNDK